MAAATGQVFQRWGEALALVQAARGQQEQSAAQRGRHHWSSSSDSVRSVSVHALEQQGKPAAAWKLSAAPPVRRGVEEGRRCFSAAVYWQLCTSVPDSQQRSAASDGRGFGPELLEIKTASFEEAANKPLPAARRRGGGYRRREPRRVGVEHRE